MTTAADYFAPWVAPTGDNWPLIVVIPGERTCACGETFPAGTFCTRCNARANGEPVISADQPPSVPTTSYLRPGEYEVVR